MSGENELYAHADLRFGNILTTSSTALIEKQAENITSSTWPAAAGSLGEGLEVAIDDHRPGLALGVRGGLAPQLDAVAVPRQHEPLEHDLALLGPVEPAHQVRELLPEMGVRVEQDVGGLVPAPVVAHRLDPQLVAHEAEDLRALLELLLGAGVVQRDEDLLLRRALERRRLLAGHRIEAEVAGHVRGRLLRRRRAFASGRRRRAGPSGRAGRPPPGCPRGAAARGSVIARRRTDGRVRAAVRGSRRVVGKHRFDLPVGC